MPFNTSMPLLYINREAFQKAGLDPDRPPTTLDEITEAARKIKETAGETVQFGFGASLYGWFVEQWNAVANQTPCDADNGRTGRVSKVDLASDTNVKLLQWWQQMVNEGLAMKLDSNTDNGDDAKERAAWELVKFLASKPSQVTWHTSTGYFPISKAALTDPADQQWVSEKPQFDTAIKQLQATQLTFATQGCSVGVMPDVRKDVENALQAAVLQGQDAKQSLATATDTATKQIADYNSKLGG